MVQSPTPPASLDTKYCAICTPLRKISPNKYPMSLDWDEDLKEQERKNQEIEDQKKNDRKTPKTGLKSSSVDTFTPHAPKSSIEQLNNRSSTSPEIEDKKTRYPHDIIRT